MGNNDEIVGYACPICDTPNPKTARYCVKCGHWLFDTYSAYEAKPITKKGFKKYFTGTKDATKEMNTNHRLSVAIGVALLIAWYFLGSINTKTGLSLLIILIGVISIIKPLAFLGIRSRLKGVSVLIMGMTILVIGSSYYQPVSTPNYPSALSSPVILSNPISLSPDEFKAQSVAVLYDDIARQTENFIGKKVILSGQIIQIEEGPDNQIIMRVNITKGQYGIYKDTVWIDYTYKQGEKRFLEKDIINLWGTVTGRKTYTSAMHVAITIPEIDATIIEMASVEPNS